MAQLGGTRDHAARPEELQLSRGESLRRHGARALALPRRRSPMRTLAHAELEAWAECGVDPGDQRAHRGRASVPGARGRADDPRPARHARRRAHRVGRRRHERARLARRTSASCSATRSSPRAPRATRPPDVAHGRARSARGRRAAPTSSSPTPGSRMGQEDERAQAPRATSSRTGSTRRCSRSRRRTRSSCTACRRTRARRSPPEVLYGERSAVWDEAENRLHVQKALLTLLLG